MIDELGIVDDIRLSDLLLLLQDNDILSEKSFAYSADSNSILYLHLEKEESDISLTSEKSRWLLLDHTETQLLSRLQREIRKRKDAQNSLLFFKQQQSKNETVDDYKMRLSGESNLSQKLSHAQMEIIALKKRIKSQRDDFIFTEKVANRVANEQREKIDRLYMQIEDQQQKIIGSYDKLESLKARERALNSSHAALLEAYSSIIAERNSLVRAKSSSARDLVKAMKIARESKEETEAFKRAIERLVDVISKLEDEEEAEGEECGARKRNTIGMCV